MEPEQAKKFSRIPFIAVLVCLIFPWIKISCAPPNSSMEVELGTISGIKLVTGGEFTPSEKASSSSMGASGFSSSSNEKSDLNPNLLAIVVILTAIGGIIMAVQNAQIAMILAGVGLFAVFLLPFDPLGQFTPDFSKTSSSPSTSSSTTKSSSKNVRRTTSSSKATSKEFEQQMGKAFNETMMKAIKISHTWGGYLVILCFIAAIYLNFIVMNNGGNLRENISSP
jgi:hypothetical protein